MKLPHALKESRDVVIDTNIFIYLYEDIADYAEIAEFIVHQAEDFEFSGVISPITLSEIVVKPYSMQRPDLADRCVRALRGYRNIRCRDIDGVVAQMAGALRAKYKRPLPDMFQAAMAMQAPVPILITNDKAMRGLSELQVFALDDFV